MKLSGVGVLAAVSANVAGPSFVSNANAQQENSEPESSALLDEFAEAAEEYDVPIALLVAIGYTNTRLSMPPAQINAYEEGEIHGYGTYGIMGLVQNPQTDTLSEASELTGIPEEELKVDRRSNILGGAALLSEYVQQASDKPQSIMELRPALAGRGNVKSPGGVGGGNDLFAEEVMQNLQDGFSEMSESGAQITLEAQDAQRSALSDKLGGVRRGLAQDHKKSLGQRYRAQLQRRG